MPINVLLKNSPRGRGPEPDQARSKEFQELPEVEKRAKEAELAAQEIQDLWESQEVGITKWSGERGQRYSDPD
ncbi:MAG: hypothetical protein H0X47_17675 [Nitrospirales bacterium]|jgi:hypothetical protein|nr:hypothetical protein [Nitrospirales bacterium]